MIHGIDGAVQCGLCASMWLPFPAVISQCQVVEEADGGPCGPGHNCAHVCVGCDQGGIDAVLFASFGSADPHAETGSCVTGLRPPAEKVATRKRALAQN